MYISTNSCVQFDYDDGFGSSADRFSIDLYRADGGSGDCGSFVTSVCDKESIGCKDSSELLRQLGTAEQNILYKPRVTAVWQQRDWMA